MSNDQWYPHVTVASIVCKDDKYLLVKESHRGRNVINQPAGHVEKNESLVEAVIRETLEETGWNIEPKYLSGIYQFVASNGETYLRFTFAGNLKNRCNEQALDPVIEDVLWMDRKTLEEYTDTLRSQVVLQCIDDYENGNQLPLDCIQQLKSPI